MRELLTKKWWLIGLRGLFAILLGLAALLLPGAAIVFYILLFGAFLLVDGIFAVIAAVGSDQISKWSFVIEGIFAIGIALLIFFWPGITAQVLAYLIAAWAFTIGIFRVFGAIALRREINEWIYIISGVLLILFSIFLIFYPNLGLKALVQTMGIFGIFIGTLILVFAFKIRSFKSY